MADFTYVGLIIANSIPEGVTGADRTYVGDIEAQAIPEGVTGADRTYVGDIEAQAIPEGVTSFSFSYIGDIVASVIPEAIVDRPLSYVGLIRVVADLGPAEGKIQVATFPFAVYTVIKIDGEDYSPILVSAVTINRETDIAASFSFRVMSTLKPASFLNRTVVLGIQAADETGVITSTREIMTGVIKQIGYSADTKEYSLSGYDYGGKHGNKGDFISSDITPVLTGTLFVDSSGSKAIGKDPIWGVTYLGSEDIVDGRDFFVNPLAGIIEIPLSSALIQTPGTLQYSYSEYFADTETLLQDIIGRKGWLAQLDNFTFQEFTAVNKQPVISLSDESVIDMARKIVELSGGRIETNNFPAMRIYSDINNFTSDVPIIYDESSIFENTLNYDINLENALTTQTVKSAAKPFPNIAISSFEEILNESGTSEWYPVSTHWFNSPVQETLAFTNAQETFIGLKPIEAVTLSVSKRNINDIQLVVGGDFFYRRNGAFVSFASIVPGDWVQSVDEDNITFTLSIKPQLVSLTSAWMVMYEGAQYTLQVNAKKIEYGEGTLDEIVAVTSTRNITGVSEVLEGDTYEHPYIETAGQAGALSDAILFEAGNFYKARYEIPIHKGLDLNLGTRIEIQQNTQREFVGIVNSIGYNVNYQGSSNLRITAKGIGKTI